MEKKVKEARFVDLQYMHLMLGGLYKFFEANAEAEGHLEDDIFQWRGLERVKKSDKLKVQIFPVIDWGHNKW